MTNFEIDETKLRSVTEPNDAWLDTVHGKAFRFVGLLILAPVLLALAAAFALLILAFPGFGSGLLIFSLIIAAGFALDGRR